MPSHEPTNRDIFDLLQKHVTATDQRFAEVFEALHVFSSHVDEQFRRVNERFAQIDQRFAQIDVRFSRIDEQFQEIHGEFKEMRQESADIRTVMATKTDLHRFATQERLDSTAATLRREWSHPRST